MQQGDVVLFQTTDDGEITVEDGLVEMSGGLETAAYLSLFGGNEDDDSSQDNPFGWWGNIDAETEARSYVSRTQNILQSLPLSSANLRRVEDAATADLQWFLSEGVASSVSVAVSVPGLNKIAFVISIEANGEESSFTFTENWKASK